MCSLFYHGELFFIDYLCCHSKTLSVLYSDKNFESKIYNELIDIGNPEVLMNLVSCHELMNKPNSTIILVCRSSLVNYYLEKGFVIIEHNPNKLSSVLNDVKLIN